MQNGAGTTAENNIKKQLQLSGYYSTTDTSSTITDSLTTAIKGAQQAYGLAPTGRINDSLITELNVPMQKRIAQLLINMNRLLWMKPVTEEHMILVNVPEFTLHVYDSGKKIFDMPVIVGKEGTNTFQFSDKLNQVVFNPYWNIPASIVRNEILPQMKKDPGYLKKRNMEIVGGGDSLPTIRQLPGKDNALGEIKFLFPNSYDIYFHDTPDKTVFQTGQRALSHGCIRLANAAKMATYLLSKESGWTHQKIQEIIGSNEEKKIVLQNPVPVRIDYLTAWVNDKGQLQFGKDIYRMDENLYQTMFKGIGGAAMPKIASSDSTMKKHNAL